MGRRRWPNILTNIETLAQCEAKIGSQQQESRADVSHGSALSTSAQRFKSAPSMSEALGSLIQAWRQLHHIKEKCHDKYFILKSMFEMSRIVNQEAGLDDTPPYHHFTSQLPPDTWTEKLGLAVNF